MADQAVVKDRPIYASVLQRELEGLIGSSVSSVSRSDLRKPEKFPVSNTVPDEKKLQ
jgi:hypothetical protein